MRVPSVGLRGLCVPEKSMCWSGSVPFRSREALCRLERILCRYWYYLPSSLEGCLSTSENTVSSPVRSSHRRHRVAAVETHLPASFTLHQVEDYSRWIEEYNRYNTTGTTEKYRWKLPFVFFLFVHLRSISPYVPAQFEFYFDYEFKLFIFPPVSLEARKRC